MSNPACSKACTKCKIFKDFSCFHKDKTQRDGFYMICKICRNAYHKRFYSENKDRIIQYQRNLRTKNIKEYNKKHKIRRDKNIEKYREYGRLAYQKHKPRVLAYQKLYAKLNKEKIEFRAKKSRAVRRRIPGCHTQKQWETLCSFFCVCPRCQKLKKFTLDHIIPISKPESSDWITNIQPLCNSCNSSKKHLAQTDYRPNFVRLWAESEMMKGQQ